MSTTPILQVKQLRKLFHFNTEGIFKRQETYVHAVDGITFDLDQGEVLGLVGESGCGKSTLALTLLGLEPATEGNILFEGREISHAKGKQIKELRRHIQMVFQDPYESLNPLMTIGEIVAEPLKVHGLTRDKNEISARVNQALEDAGLKPADIYYHRYPHQLSGGQRQRVVIAGALVLQPTLLLADEPVSMLDVSIRAEILNLLADLRTNYGISILFITHDLATAAYFTDRVAVMYLGRIVEIGPTLEVLSNPAHPYTKALLSVIPVPNPRQRHERIILSGDPPNPVNLPAGCRFHPRCPMVFDRCRLEDPKVFDLGNNHSVHCWLLEN
ncbi:MAG: ABC transporter ATP-binding protein [Chloroflexota bacterium]|nr:MAG: ABC transporter ATP-binding protein [Chloroflexota bacterium]